MRRLKLIAVSSIMTLIMSSTALAGSWQGNETGWWYQNDDGSYPANTWQWIDGDGDGISENYYFNENGYCLMNTTTPDGNTVDANGAWTVNGIVQTQAVVPAQQTTAPTTTQPVTQSGISSTPYEGYTIIVNTNTKKYHVPSCRSVKDMKTENTGYCSDVAYLDSQGYAACKNCH